MGLSGSGKSNFCAELRTFLRPHLYLNADSVRKESNDWDFSREGRIRQAQRMKSLIENSNESLFLVDMICPLKEMREIICADTIFFMNRRWVVRYQDTDAVFEVPTRSECEFFYEIC